MNAKLPPADEFKECPACGIWHIGGGLCRACRRVELASGFEPPCGYSSGDGLTTEPNTAGCLLVLAGGFVLLGAMIVAFCIPFL